MAQILKYKKPQLSFQRSVKDMSGVYNYTKTSTVTGSKIRNELISGTILDSIKEPTDTSNSKQLQSFSNKKQDNTMVISYNISKSQTESKQ